MRPLRLHVGHAGHLGQDVHDVMFGHGLALRVAEHTRRLEVPVYLERLGEALGQRHVSQTTSFRCRDVAVPVVTLDAELALREVDVRPLAGAHLAGSQPSIPTEQDNEPGPAIDASCGRDQLFVLDEVNSDYEDFSETTAEEASRVQRDCEEFVAACEAALEIRSAD